MMDRRNKIMKHDTLSNDIYFIFFCVFHVTITWPRTIDITRSDVSVRSISSSLCDVSFHSHTPRIQSKPKTLSRQKRRQREWAGTNYPGVRKGYRFCCKCFLSFSVVTHVMRYWFVALTVLAASGHLAYDVPCFVTLLFLPIAGPLLLGGGGRTRNRRSCTKFRHRYVSWPEDKLLLIFNHIKLHFIRRLCEKDETLQQVGHFTYLRCNISYQFSNDVESKSAKIFTINWYYWENYF
jgi:hypothetical protein